MNSTDERLSDLLAQRARQRSGVHPTREGVGIAVSRRAARRRRQRVVVTGLAGLCLVAGVVGGFALAGDDATQEDGFTSPTGPLPDVPLVGLDIDGFELTSAAITPVDDSGEPPTSYVVFRSPDSLAGPLLRVAVRSSSGNELPGRSRTPLDLDGDGQADGPHDGWLTWTPGEGTGVAWLLDDGQMVLVGGYDVGQESMIAYATDIAGGSLDLATLPAPEGLPDRSAASLPSGLPAEQATSIYRNGDGEIRVTTRNEPGWFDFLQIYHVHTYDGFEAAEVGEAFFGPSRGIVSEPAPGHPYALVLTDSGLTIEVSTEFSDAAPGLDVTDLQALLADGAFVEVEPTDGPPTTTALAPATTAPPVTTTSIVTVLEPLPAVTRTVDDTGEHIRFAFDDFQPTVGTLTVLETLNPPCARFAEDYDIGWRRSHEGSAPDGQGWLTVEIGARFAADPTAVFVPGNLGYILCGHTANSTTIAVPVASLGEPTVTPFSGRPAILIDIPR